MTEASGPENRQISSKIRELQYLDINYNGWTTTNEDHWVLLEGLKAAHMKRKGGFFAVGEYQNIDIALQLGTSAIVLGDLDQDAVKKNLGILRIVENAHDVSEVLPKLFEYIRAVEGEGGLASLKARLSPKGDGTGARVRLAWAQSQEEFQ